MVLTPLSANAFEYVTRLEDSSWRTRSSPYVCRLEHEIEGYGTGQFVHRAGESQRLNLTGQGYEFDAGKVRVYADPPAWRPGVASSLIGSVAPEDGEVVVKGEIATDVMAALANGMLIGFKGRLKESNRQSFDVFLSSVGFYPAYEDFKRCEDQLLPANFSQVERSRIQYQSGGTDISAAGRLQLDHVLAYLKSDASVLQVFVDGHADNAGMPRDNVTLSETRAIRVTEYLVRNGCPAEKIVTRYHGEKYPVASNDDPKTIAQNRRTTVRLSREGPSPETETGH